MRLYLGWGKALGNEEDTGTGSDTEASSSSSPMNMDREERMQLVRVRLKIWRVPEFGLKRDPALPVFRIVHWSVAAEGIVAINSSRVLRKRVWSF